jgi:hypothetical protein
VSLCVFRAPLALHSRGNTADGISEASCEPLNIRTITTANYSRNCKKIRGTSFKGYLRWNKNLVSHVFGFSP